MGYSSSVVIGAVLRLEEKSVTEPAQAKGCSRSCGAPYVEGTRFCGNCGARIQDAKPERQTVKRIRPHEVAGGEFEDMFFSPEYGPTVKGSYIWFYNFNDKDIRSFSPETDQAYLPLDAESMAKVKSKFEEKWAPVIKALADEFQVKAYVEVGVFSYVH